jgi:hypothetical protein
MRADDFGLIELTPVFTHLNNRQLQVFQATLVVKVVILFYVYFQKLGSTSLDSALIADRRDYQSGRLMQLPSYIFYPSRYADTIPPLNCFLYIFLSFPLYISVAIF